MIRRNDIRDVVLVAYWTSYFEDTPENYAKYGITKDPFAEALLRTVKDLRGLGVRVFFQRQAPSYTVRVPEELARRSLFVKVPVTGEVSFDELRIDSEPMRLLERALAKEGVNLVDAVATLSTRAGTPIVAAGGKTLYGDNHHLSTDGAARLLPVYRAALAL